MSDSGAKIASSLTEMVSRLEDLELLLDVLMDGVLILDHEGRFLHLNKGAEKAFGTSRQEIKGRSFWESPWHLRLEAEPAGEDGKLLFEKVLKGGDSLAGMKLTLNRPDGTSGFYLLNATPWIRDGKKLGLVAVFTDVTETRKAEMEKSRIERERKRLLARLEATIHSLGHAVIIYDEQGAIVSANPRAEEITGFPAETFSLSFADRWGQLRVETPEGKALLPERLPTVRALQGEQIVGEVLVFRHSPEKAAWVAVNAGPIICEGGTIGTVVSFSDLTDLHRLRERDRTFMRMVSHDIRLPLTVIQGHAELLQAGVGQGNEEELARSTDAIFAAVSKAGRILDDLAELNLLEQGRVVLDRQRISPPALIRQILTENAQALDQQRLSVEMPEQLPEICADYKRFERIIINLVTNALKFSPREKKVRIRAAREGDEVIFAVTDQGRGIDSSELPRLFDPYYRSKTTEATAGSGLGLYIARLLTQAHGGRIWAESQLGSGSTFYVAVPIECQSDQF